MTFHDTRSIARQVGDGGVGATRRYDRRSQGTHARLVDYQHEEPNMTGVDVLRAARKREALRIAAMPVPPDAIGYEPPVPHWTAAEMGSVVVGLERHMTDAQIAEWLHKTRNAVTAMVGRIRVAATMDRSHHGAETQKKRLGRPRGVPSEVEARVRELRASGKPWREVAKASGLRESTARYLVNHPGEEA